MKTVALIRQAPSSGDMCLLGVTCRALKEQGRADEIVVVTDPNWSGGALVETAKMIPWVDDVLPMASDDRTTPENHHYRKLKGSTDLVAHLQEYFGPDAEILDANTAFLKHEWEYDGAHKAAKPPKHSITEFWLRHFDLWRDGIDTLPKLDIPATTRLEVMDWLYPGDTADVRPILGIVLRSHEERRDWDVTGRYASVVADWAQSMGYRVVTIDEHKRLEDPGVLACANRSITFAAGVVEKCKAILTPDTGMLHVAQAVGTPSVSVWAYTDPQYRTQGYRTIRVPKVPKPDSYKEGFYTDPRQTPFREIIDGLGLCMSLPS